MFLTLATFLTTATTWWFFSSLPVTVVNGYDSRCAQYVSKFAPHIYFETDENKYGFPSDADLYYKKVVKATNPANEESLINHDATQSKMPTYARTEVCSNTNKCQIIYRRFYPYQKGCTDLYDLNGNKKDPGEHGAGFGEGMNIEVDLNSGQIYRIMYKQHTGYYWIKGNDISKYVKFDGTHPIAYAGQQSGGTYNNAQDRVACTPTPGDVLDLLGDAPDVITKDVDKYIEKAVKNAPFYGCGYYSDLRGTRHYLKTENNLIDLVDNCNAQFCTDYQSEIVNDADCCGDKVRNIFSKTEKQCTKYDESTKSWCKDGGCDYKSQCGQFEKYIAELAVKYMKDAISKLVPTYDCKNDYYYRSCGVLVCKGDDKVSGTKKCGCKKIAGKKICTARKAKCKKCSLKWLNVNSGLLDRERDRARDMYNFNEKEKEIERLRDLEEFKLDHMMQEIEGTANSMHYLLYAIASLSLILVVFALFAVIYVWGICHDTKQDENATKNGHSLIMPTETE